MEAIPRTPSRSPLAAYTPHCSRFFPCSLVLSFYSYLAKVLERCLGERVARRGLFEGDASCESAARLSLLDRFVTCST